MADCDRGRALPESEAAYFAALGASRQSNGISAIRNRAPRMAVPTGRLGCYAGRAIRALRERGTMKRGRKKVGRVGFDKRIRTWHFIWWGDGKRKSKDIGSGREVPTKE